MDKAYLDECKQELMGVGFTEGQAGAMIGIFCDMVSEECSTEISSLKDDSRKAEIKFDV